MQATIQAPNIAAVPGMDVPTGANAAEEETPAWVLEMADELEADET